MTTNDVPEDLVDEAAHAAFGAAREVIEIGAPGLDDEQLDAAAEKAVKRAAAWLDSPTPPRAER